LQTVKDAGDTALGLLTSLVGGTEAIGGAGACVAGGAETLGLSCAGGLAVATAGSTMFGVGIENMLRGGDNLGHDLGAMAQGDGASSGGSSPGTVTRNALSDDEYSQAQGIVDHLGGNFEGQTVANEPGIDGTYDGIPASLKEIQPGSVNPTRALANTVTNAANSASKAGYSGVWLFVRSSGLSMADVSGSLRIPQIMQQGVITRVSVETSDGWFNFQ
jgi:hypothetical protein